MGMSRVARKRIFPSRKPEEFVASGHMRPLRLSNMLQDRGDYWRWTAHDAWQQLVETYSNCALTYEDDQFPAMSGVARRFDQILHDKYLAGMWKGDLHQSLLWMKVWHSSSLHESMNTRRSTYTGTPYSLHISHFKL
jgi:hypothetical protein